METNESKRIRDKKAKVFVYSFGFVMMKNGSSSTRKKFFAKFTHLTIEFLVFLLLFANLVE